MFTSLLGSATSAIKNAHFSPQELAAVSLAFERYSRSGDFLIDDAYLESRLEPALASREEVTDFALFGMKDHLRCIARGRVLRQDVEGMVVIRPVDVHWGTYFRFVFDVEIVRWEVEGAPSRLAGIALRKAVAAFLPLGGVLNIIGAAAINKAGKSAGLAQLKAIDGLSDRGLTWQNSRATVDLTAQPELEFFFQEHGGGLLSAASSALGMGTSMATQLKVTDLEADRSGLLLKATLSPSAHAAFSTTAQAFKLLQGSTRALQKPLSDQHRS